MSISQLMKMRKQTQVLVVGDIMLDQYTRGRVSRVSQEAPVPVLADPEDAYVLGGAANVAANLAAMEVRVRMFGAVGSDHFGKFTRDKIKCSQIDGSHVIVDGKRVTTVKQRVTAGQQIVRIDRETVRPITPAQVYTLARKIEAHIPRADAVVVSDYGKGVVTPELMARITTACNKHEVFIAMNARPANNRAIPANIDALIVNRREAFELSGLQDNGDMHGVHSAARNIYRHYMPRLVVVTLGGDGILIYHCPKNGNMKISESIKHVPTTPSAVVDVSGCGDTVVAFFVLGAALGFGYVDAAKLANKAAGIVVKKVGTAVVLPKELVS